MRGEVAWSPIKMQNLHIGVLGAGIVGLATALSLQQAGCRVTLIDRDSPGMGASFGNAGLFADYARLPFSKLATLRAMPGMLLDRSSPLSMRLHYLPALLPYGWAFCKASRPAQYARGKAALSQLQEHCRQADRELLERAQAQDLLRAEGCLGLFASAAGFAAARKGDLRERREQGVVMEFIDAAGVRELEPDLAPFHAGGVFYPETRFTLDPHALCERLVRLFVANGGVILRDQVLALKPGQQGVEVRLSDSMRRLDQVVVALGDASARLLKPLGVRIPLVSERGYHLMLHSARSLRRPVGWLDKAVFLTPMRAGIRLAGTAEFARSDAAPDPHRTEVMLEHAAVMLGEEPEVRSSWVGSRPSTPDSLPVIGALASHPRVKVAFGHGHLGLTLAAITAQLVRACILDQPTPVDLQPFSPQRFS